MSTTLTIEGLDDASLDALKAESLRRGVDVAVVVRDILQQALTSTAAPEYHDLDHLAGTWSEADAQDFIVAIAGMRQVDPELWK